MIAFRFYLAGVLVCLLCGCATTANLNSIPIKDAEFEKPLDDIKAEYTDVSLYEDYWRGFIPQLGNYSDLENKWGKADRIEKRWGEKIAGSAFGAALVAYGALPLAAYVAIETLFFYPNETHYWNKGSAQVEAVVTRPGILGYEKKLAQWKWKNKDVGSQSDEVSVSLKGDK